MIKTKKLFVLVFLLLNCILFSACSQSKEVDFVKKYKIDLYTISDVTEVLQKAIDLYLLDNCTISGNTIEGFERPIVANSCDEQFISDTDIVTE